MDFTVWGDQTEPVLEGTEDECKAFVVSHEERIDLYLAAPDGTEWDYNRAADLWEKL